jgi:hypothetical protein
MNMMMQAVLWIFIYIFAMGAIALTIFIWIMFKKELSEK